MARVPTYDELQVAPRGLPGPQQSGVSPDAFGYAARQQATEAKAIGDAADVGTNIAVKMQEREDTDMLLRAEVAFHDELLQFETEAKKRKGADAKGLTQETDAFFNDARKKYVEVLANDRQRQAFIQRITPVRQSTMRSISGFEEKERVDSFLKASEARTNVAIRMAAGNAHDWEIVGQQRAEIERQARAIQAEMRWTPEQYQDYLDRTKTTFHTQVLQDLVKNPETRMLAKKYFEKFEKDIPGDVRAELGDQARRATESSLVDATVEDITKKFRPTAPDQPVKWEDANSAIDAALRGVDPEVRARAKTMFRDNMAQYEKQIKSDIEKEEAQFHLMQMTKNMSVAQITRTPEFQLLLSKNATRAKAIETSLLSFEHAKISRAAAAANLEDANLRKEVNRALLNDRKLVMDNYEFLNQTYDPLWLQQVSPEQASLFRNKLGHEEGSRAYQRWLSIRDRPEKVFEAKLDNDMFLAAAAKVGLKVDGLKPDDHDGKARVRELRNAVETELMVAAKYAKRQLDVKEKQEIVDRITGDLVTKPGWFSNTTLPRAAVLQKEEEAWKSKGAFITIRPEAVGGAYRMVGLDVPPPTQEQRLQSLAIPRPERDDITRVLRAHGQTPTEEAIAALHLARVKALEIRKQREANRPPALTPRDAPVPSMGR